MCQYSYNFFLVKTMLDTNYETYANHYIWYKFAQTWMVATWLAGVGLTEGGATGAVCVAQPSKQSLAGNIKNYFNKYWMIIFYSNLCIYQYLTEGFNKKAVSVALWEM